MKSIVRTLGELGDDVVLAPERWLAGREDEAGIPLGDLVVERREPADLERALVLDTTHARDGLLDIAAGLRAVGPPKSAKRSCQAGDIVLSRLRPYLRQIAFVHPRALAAAGRDLALSTEFYVLAPRSGDIAFLLPFLLGAAAQRTLAAAQEGGHHPRVPRSAVMALRVPEAVVAERVRRSRDVTQALDALYRSLDRFQSTLSGQSSSD